MMDCIVTANQMAFPSHTVLGWQKIVKEISGLDPGISATGNLDRLARSTSTKGQPMLILTLESWLSDQSRLSGQSRHFRVRRADYSVSPAVSGANTRCPA